MSGNHIDSDSESNQDATGRSVSRRGLLKATAASVFGAGLLGSDAPGIPDAVGTASATNGAEPYRPDYHFSPEDGWMNDPNGMVYYDGTYHLFYQAGENHRRWDHATSTDLRNWTEHGTKIPDTSTIQAFSGGAVIDKNNTSGFGTDAMVCMYTGHHDDTGEQDQRIAHSTDGGDTVIKYSGNPVLADGHDDWRDPNPFWYEPTGNWRMVIARVSANGTDRPAGIEIYESDDLIDWTYLSTYESGGAGWECPDLYTLPVTNTNESRWVMTVSVEWDHVEHHIGHFDGTTFTVDNTVYADSGRDFYGGQSWDNEPATDSRLMLSWMNHWDYATDTPDNGWKGAQSFPRRVELEDTGNEIVPRQTLDSALTNERTGTLVELSNETIDADTDPLDDHETVGEPFYEILAVIDPGDADSVTLKTRVDEGIGQETLLTYDSVTDELILDRNNAGNYFGDTSKDTASQPLTTRSDGTVKLRVLVDRSSITSIANDGEKTMTNQIFPDETSTDTGLTASGGTATLESLTLYSYSGGLVDGGTYRIENVNSGKTLEVQDAGTSDGDAVQQWDYLEYDHQQWIAHEISGGRFWFENVNSGNALDIQNASTEQGADTVQWEWWGGDNQQWDIYEVENGIYRAVNVNSGWSLDIEDASTADGARGMQWEWWGGDNQKWRFERLD